MKSNPFAFVLDQIETRMPEPLKPFQAEVKNFSKRVLQEKLNDLDLVPRSEFEQQQQLLSAAQKRIADLEARIAALEAQKSAQ